MLVNEYGFVVCLLNKWDKEGLTKSATKSRGQLVLKMAAVRCLDEVPKFLEDFRDYPAFTLVVFLAEKVRSWEWDGNSLSLTTPTFPMTSSSFSYEEVKKTREDAFTTQMSGADYHASTHEETCTAYSVRMNRPDAQTWSRSHLIIGPEIVWEYFAEQPDLVKRDGHSLLKK